MSHLSVILSVKFLSSIFSTVFIILVGYYARKKNIVNESGAKILSSLLLSVTLPFLAFNAFMVNITKETYTTGINVLIFGFAAYILLIVLGYVFYIGYKGNLKDVMVVLTAFGSTTFFGIPIINGLLGNTGTIYANIFNIAYRVFLYSFALIVMSGLKFEKKNLKQIFLNPIIIATFLGLLIWVFQKSLPQFTVTEGDKTVSYAVLRLDKSVPWVFRGFKYLGDLSSPLAWLAIGMTLASISIKDALKEKKTLIYSAVKLIIIPAFFLLLMLALGKFAGIGFQYEAVVSIIIMLATPPATVAVAYAIKFEKEAVLASNISLVSTLLSVFAIIVWIIVLMVLHASAVI